MTGDATAASYARLGCKQGGVAGGLHEAAGGTPAAEPRPALLHQQRSATPSRPATKLNQPKQVRSGPAHPIDGTGHSAATYTAEHIRRTKGWHRAGGHTAKHTLWLD
jgi:hypothetical protein